MHTLTYTCVGCQLRCRLLVTVEDETVQSVSGNRCKRALDLARRRLKARVAEFLLQLRVLGGCAARVEARATEPVTADVARAIGAAVRSASVAAPVTAGDVLIRDAAGLGIDLVAIEDVQASAP